MITSATFDTIVKDLDSRQREAVFRDTNCVVTAGAGSGKTTVLSYRFLRLVALGQAHVDEILTLTFSRAAAAEMFERIRMKLHEYQDDPDIRLEISRFPDATITTIDAFCNRIVASDPTRYGIGPDYVTDEEANKEMAAECVYRLLSEMEGHTGLDFLASLYGPDELVHDFLVRLAEQEFHPASTFNAFDQANAVGELVRQAYDANLALLLSCARQLVEMTGSGKTFEKNQMQARLLIEKEHLLVTCSDPEESLSCIEAFKVRKCTGKQAHVELCNEVIAEIREIYPIVEKSCAALRDAFQLEPMYAVLSRFRDIYLATKRERGVLTFNDIAHMARDILIHNPVVRNHYKRKFRYVMVDEFQDTNQLQKDLVYLVSERLDRLAEAVPSATDLTSDKLFFVGDEKQSIYRFRGADVTVFKEIGQEMEEATGEPSIRLEHNYRSEPELITVFNTTFESIMGSPSHPFEARFESLKARSANELVQPNVSFYFKERKDRDPAETADEDNSGDDAGETIDAVDDVQAEAYAISQLIDTMVKSDDYLIADQQEGTRRPSYSDIAILFRTSSNQLHYEKALRLAGIPYVLSAVQSLFLEAPANDLYSMLQLLIFGQDRLAFTAVLRSPLCRMSDDAIVQILRTMEREQLQVFSPLPEGVCHPEDAEKYLFCCNLYRELLEMAQSESIATLLMHIWYAGGYRYYLLSDPLYHVYLEHFDFLCELAMQYDEQEKGLPAFLDFVRPRLGQNQKLEGVEPLRDGINGVQIMTVHKSKGLEFPIVILANMGSGPGNNRTPLWHTVNVAGMRLIVPRHMRRYKKTVNLFYDSEKDLLAAKESAEMRRLLYVALTRAKTHLVLSGCENAKNMTEKAVEKNFLALFLSNTRLLEDTATCGHLWSVHSIEDAPIEVLRASVPRKRIRNRLAAMLPLYADPAPPRIVSSDSVSVTSLVSEISDGTTEGLHPKRLPEIPADPLIAEQELASSFGTWVHALIERALPSATGQQSGCTLSSEDARLTMPKEFTRADLSGRDLETLEQSTRLLARNFFESALFHQLLLERPVSIESEIRFSLREEQVDDMGKPLLVNGSIDLLIRYETCVKIVDFKTDAFRLEQEHEMQLSWYREAAKRLYGLPVWSTVCYLRSVGSERWVG